MSGLSFRRVTQADARAIAAWRWEDVASPDLESLRDPSYEYHAALGSEGELVGYCCFGSDARVPGLAEEAGVLDVGLGLRPDLVGIGLGASFLRAVCRLGRDLHRPDRLRLVTSTANVRMQRVAGALGFERRDGPRGFVVFERRA